MSWAKFDDGFPEHPKVLAVGPIAQGIDVDAICYSARNLTDGFVPRAIYRALVSRLERIGVFEHGGWTDATTIDWASRLVAAGLWGADPARDGWTIHDYLEYNPSKAEVEAGRAEWRQKSVLGGKARASQAERTSDGKFTSHDPSRTAGTTAGPSQPTDQPNTRPVPVPVPVPVPAPGGSPESRTIVAGRGSPEGETLPERREKPGGRKERPLFGGLTETGETTGAPVESLLGGDSGPGGSTASKKKAGARKPRATIRIYATETETRG